MNFLCNLFNHSEVGQRSLEDVIGIFGHQMRALGHSIIWEQSNHHFLKAEDGINIVVEGFTSDSINIIAAAHAQGARFLMLATEEPTDKGFNHGTQEEMVRRQIDFPDAAKFFEGILHLVPGDEVTRWYGQFAPSAYVELGYAPSLVRKQRIEPDYDFGFYGSLTDRRLKILKKLANKVNKVKAVKVVADFKTQVERDEQMMRAKVVLQVRKFDAMGLVSSSRCNTALCLGRPVVAEPHLLCKPWDEVVQFTDSMDHFFNAAMLAVANWRGLHAVQMDRFKEKFTPEFCVGRVLDQIGILQEKRIAA